jgi:hypothetical protein
MLLRLSIAGSMLRSGGPPCECDGRCFEQLTYTSARQLHDWWRAERGCRCSEQPTHMPLARLVAHLNAVLGRPACTLLWNRGAGVLW